VAERLKLSQQVNERPLSDWAPIAVEFLGAESVIIEGERWRHHVIHKGDGPPLLMYHGIGGHAETYARTLPQIAAAGFHVYAVDALYHGYSSKPDLPDRSKMGENQVEAVIDLIDALGYDRVHYEGESMGAMIGTELGLKYPDRTQKIILNGFGMVATERPMPDFTPSPGPPMGDLFPLSIAAVTDPTFDNIAKRLHWLVKEPSRITDEMVLLRQRLYRDPDINRMMRQVFGVGQPPPDFAAMLASARTEAEVHETWKPEALVLWGDHNPGMGLEYGEYCADIIGAKFHPFADAGHWPQWEKPDEYSQVMIDFLKS
jgi:pimeloyl-ACP methyl ester carboxylesterase